MRTCQELHLSVRVNGASRGSSVAWQPPRGPSLSEVCGFLNFPSRSRRAAPTGQTRVQRGGGGDGVTTLARAQDFTRSAAVPIGRFVCRSGSHCSFLPSGRFSG